MHQRSAIYLFDLEFSGEHVFYPFQLEAGLWKEFQNLASVNAEDFCISFQYLLLLALDLHINRIILMYKYVYLLTIQDTLFAIISFGKNA